MSSNAGGLIVWPAKLLVPLGFLLLILQTLAEIIKRIAYLAGLIDDSSFTRAAPAAAAVLPASHPAP